MSLSATASDASPGRIGDAGLAILATLVLLALQAAAGFPSLAGAAGDSDSPMRLVEVRDLLAGQGWFDLHQYRMGSSGGFVMHWSRLVDAPIAALVLAGAALTGSQAGGETVALVLWPALLFCAAMFCLLRLARAMAGPQAMLPALLLGATTLYYIGSFAPGAIDHHNLQLVLALAMLALLADAAGDGNSLRAAAAGTCAALLLAVAMEGAPYVAAAGAAVALWFLLDPLSGRRVATAFGLAFGTTAAVIFVATVGPGDWMAAQCDAFSTPQLAGAALSGFGLAAIASIPVLAGALPSRLAACAVLGVVVAAVFVLAFPQCLQDPYAGLDPRLKSWWLEAVTEAQPLWKVAAVSPAMAAGHYATPLLALACLGWAAWRGTLARPGMLVAALLAAALLVSVWQLRGSVFALPLAVAPLAALIAHWRARAAAMPTPAATLGVAAAWLLSLNVVWSLAVGSLADLLSPARFAAAAAVTDTQGGCEQAGDYARLAALPPTGVLVISNLGSHMLRHTPHRVLAGPYHRNVAGNLAALDAFTGPIDAAAEDAHANGMALLALCRGNGETIALAERAPQGLLAALLRGDSPDWLEILPKSRGEALQLFRIHAND